MVLHGQCTMRRRESDGLSPWPPSSRLNSGCWRQRVPAQPLHLPRKLCSQVPITCGTEQVQSHHVRMKEIGWGIAHIKSVYKCCPGHCLFGCPESPPLLGTAPDYPKGTGLLSFSPGSRRVSWGWSPPQIKPWLISSFHHQGLSHRH